MAVTSQRTVGDRLAEDLRGAVTVLERDGWSREQLHAKDGTGHDITGAVYVACGYHQPADDGSWRAVPMEKSAGRRATDCIRWLLRNLPAGSVWEFNDRMCLNRDAAVDALNRAADNAQRLLRDSRDVERLLS